MNGQTSGRFLAFEGIDGSGKSTQLQLLLERLRERGVECRGTREPSDGPVGAMLRQILSPAGWRRTTGSLRGSSPRTGWTIW